MNISRVNNFDLIRFVAALQVVIIHANTHLNIPNNNVTYQIIKFLDFFPGVPIFFVVSGFLIYASFERNKDKLGRFFKNRFLRLYPALWVCFLVTVVLLLFDYKGDNFLFSGKQSLFWFLGQLSIAQFYTPDFLRFWGVGTPNGSLWTIAVEVQFYLLTPFIFFFASRLKNGYLWFVILFIFSICANVYLYEFKVADEFIGKLSAVSILPYLYYFLIGILAYLLWPKIKSFFEHKFLFWISAYLIFGYILYLGFDINITSYWIRGPLSIIADFLLAGVVLSLAFTKVNLSHKLLKGNDISYGMYIYHMLWINFLLHRELKEEWIYLFVAIGLTAISAFLSWKFIEKPALKLKFSKST